ncbi:hypothetical protein AVEN_252341-1 [Araneus ventricosus]|uniref:Uncharacterized protein n=1 Tax=Araneus ventricosus TaxID=182803 RepID=A0A4Y2AT40_ARAVE|nr:hypothetical protein AVEN_252341-1 [Araneus ventricosus]
MFAIPLLCLVSSAWTRTDVQAVVKLPLRWMTFEPECVLYDADHSATDQLNIIVLSTTIFKLISGLVQALLITRSNGIAHITKHYVWKRLRNIANRKAHNLYLNHTQATPNAEFVDYEVKETDCSSDISEVILNLNTYKPSTSNRLISLTDPEYKQLTPFLAKSLQMRLGLSSTAVVGVSDRAVAAIASSVLHDVDLITSNNSDLMVD